MNVRIIIGLLIACSVLISTTTAAKQPAVDQDTANLHIAVASNFKTTLKSLITLYTTKHSVNIILSSASTGKLTTQIRFGAPYDIFLAADEQRPMLLIADGLAFKQSIYVYATGQLAFITRIKSAKSASDALDSGQIKQLALANYKTAPYGQVARDWLESSTYDLSSLIFITSENISQTWQHFQQGGVDAALVALPQILLSKSNIYPYWLLPDKINAQLTQAGVIIKSSNNKLRAENFMEFLKSNEARTIIANAGYKLNDQVNTSH